MSWSRWVHGHYPSYVHPKAVKTVSLYSSKPNSLVSSWRNQFESIQSSHTWSECSVYQYVL